ncbi:MAG TPA: pseudouridine synthase [Spirochaetota bacterium]|nr:pseudouridine synthase [Spirochaetota bacterium]HPJ33667.1 pseudouridine synthase [Spirochaetota bacterium]
MMKVRLNKYLTLCGLGSRRKVEELITSGRISINGEVVINLATVIDAEKDSVSFNGAVLSPSGKNFYLVLNKPKGYVTTVKDEKGRATVMDLIPERFINAGVMPVGRLDMDTEGLLILTNDGELAYRLTRPSFKVAKEYIVDIDKPLEEADRRKLEKGYFVHQIKVKTGAATVTLLDKSGFTVKMIIKEGKKRQIRYSFKNLGYRVVKLKRVAYGPLSLGRLNRGEYRLLKENEVKLLRRSTEPAVKKTV